MWSNIFSTYRQLQKKAQHNFIGQLKNLWNLPTYAYSRDRRNTQEAPVNV